MRTRTTLRSLPAFFLLTCGLQSQAEEVNTNKDLVKQAEFRMGDAIILNPASNDLDASTSALFELAGAYTNTVSVTAPYPDVSAILLVSIDQAPNAGGDGELSICASAAPVDLFTHLEGEPDPGGTWSGPSNTSGLFDPATMSPGTYTYTAIVSGEPVSASVVVTVVEAPDAGGDAVLIQCSNFPPVNMQMFLSGSPDQGGTWSGPSATNGIFLPATMLAGAYTYTVSGGGVCPDASAVLTIGVMVAPDAGIGNTMTVCSDAGPFLLLVELNGSPNSIGSWLGPDGNSTGIFLPGTSPQGTYTYTVAGVAPCGNASADLVVNVIDLQLDSIDGPTGVEQVEPIVFSALPFLADADSFSWSIPEGWNWATPDSTSATAVLIPSGQTGPATICVTAYGGGCVGNELCFTTAITVGGQELSAHDAQVVLFPNPSDGVFNVTFASAERPESLFISDALGRLVLAFNGPFNAGFTTLDLHGMNAGTYRLYIRTGERVEVLPLVLVY